MISPSPSTAEAAPLRQALLQRVRGIGPERAARLLTTYGDGLDHVLRDPGRIPEVAAVLAPDRPRLGRRIATGLVGQWRAALAPEYASFAWLERHGVTEAPSLAHRVVSILGERTPEILADNPYVLAKALAWSRMDDLGRRALACRLDGAAVLMSPQRLLGAIDSAVADLIAQGHTAALKPQLRTEVAKRLGDAVLASEAVALAVRRLRLIDSRDIWRFPGCAWMEGSVTTRLARMGREHGAIATDEPTCRGILATTQDKLGFSLSKEQAEAVINVLKRPFAVVSGGAGTGKTAMMRAVVEAWEGLGGNVHLCALAGKAALRLSQATGRLAKTLCRTVSELKSRRRAEDEAATARTDWTLLDDRTLVVVDEASMVDLGLWAELLNLIPPGCRLAMVGDVAQLPPIGFGLVFHLLALRPDTIRLTQVFRQGEATGIPVVAQAIRERALTSLPIFRGPGCGVSLKPAPVDGLDAAVVDAALQLGGFGDNGLALHVVCAMNFRVDALNRRFHDLRRGERAEITGGLGVRFSIGDPVIYTENDCLRGLFNGLLGTVVDVDPVAQEVFVRFEDDLHWFGKTGIGKLDLAYALTCHKLQGSQAPRIIIVIEPTRQVEPSWLYTAVTRAVEQAVVVGPPSAIRAALDRMPAWQRRITGYSRLLSAIIKP